MPSRIHIYLPHIFHRCPSLSFIFHTRHSLLHNLYFHSHPSPTFAYFTGALLRMSQTPSYWMYIQRHPSTECIFRDTLLQNSHFTDTLLSAKFFFFFTGTLPQNSRVTDDFFHTDHFIYFHWHSSPDLRFTGALLHGSYFTDAFLHISQMQITQIMFTDALLQKSHFPDALLQSSQTPSREF